MRSVRWVAAVGASVIGVALAALACSTITLPPEITAPVNSCNDSLACQATFPDASLPTCAGGTCVAANGFVPVLVVSTPSNAPVEPGLSIGLPNEPIPFGTKIPACDGGCTFLPPPQVTVAQINVTLLLAEQLVPPGGLQPNVPVKLGSPTDTSLPLTATFWPLWRVKPQDPSSPLLLAGSLGLPLNETTATSEASPLVSPSQPTNGTSPGPGQAVSATLVGGFTPTDTTLGNYLLQLVPNDPYSMFPPLVAPIIAGQPTLRAEYTQAAQGQYIESTTYDVKTNAGAPSLAGWTAYAVDSHGFRITGKVALTGAANESFTLYDATGTTDQTGERLYVLPPSGVDLPIYVDTAIGSLLSQQISYPALPPPVTVGGSVILDTDPARIIAARIVFIADGAPDGAAVLTTDVNTPFSQQLYYRAETTTDATGQYQLTLPPGKYRAYAIPSDPDLALTIKLQTLTTGGAGKTVTVQSRAHVRGSVVLGDGTPVYGAQVVIDPSADAPFTTGFDPLALPRESIASTDVNGQFDVLVDPGVVDISVRPQDGTRYPWVVSTNWKVLSDTALPRPVVIPPPGDPSTARSGGQLADAIGNPLAHTLVRAYGFPPPATAGDGSAPSSRGARLVGMTISDETGGFELYVAPPDP